MMHPDVRTHLQIQQRLCGVPQQLGSGKAVVQLVLTGDMASDERGLVHGGFTFGLADYAAMLAVNHPNVVLGGAEVRFLKPTVVGDTVVAEAVLEEEKGAKRTVLVEVSRGEEKVFQGVFTCFVPEHHVLDR